MSNEEGESYLDELLNTMTSYDQNPEMDEDYLLQQEEEEELKRLKNEEKKPIIKDDDNEDISELLDLLSEHYDEESEAKEDLVESSIGVEDVFSEALSAVSYASGDDEEYEGLFSGEEPELPVEPELSMGPELLEEPEELDDFGGFDESEQSEQLDEEPLFLDDSVMPEEEIVPEKSKEKKPSLKERFFQNIIDDKEIEREEKARQNEEKSKEQAAAEKEKLKQEKLAKKEADEAKKQEEKERKDLDKAAKAEETKKLRQQKLEEKKKRQEEAAKEYVGRINPVGAAIVFLLFGIVALSVIFGTNVISYKGAVTDAQIFVDTNNYERAYKAVAGVKLSDSDQELYEKVRLLAKLDQRVRSSENFIKMNMPWEALDSLVKAVEQYDESMEEGKRLEISGQQDGLFQKVEEKLHQDFHMTTAEARQILQSATSEEYAQRIEQRAVLSN